MEKSLIDTKVQKWKQKPQETILWQHEDTGRLITMTIGKRPGLRWYQVKE